MKNLLNNKILSPFTKLYGYQRCLQHKDLDSEKNGELIQTNHPFFQNKVINNQNDLKIAKEINSVTGWIPYIKDKTSLVIYNFFSMNYAIRKNLIMKVNILKNHKLIFSKYLTLEQNNIMELDKKFFKNVKTSNGIIVVQLFHPNIPNNHGGNGGQFRFWGKYYDKNNNYLSTVHSSPLGYTQFSKPQIHSRNYFPKNVEKKNKILNVSLNKNDFDYENNDFRIGGYNIILDKKNNPHAIWHLGPAFVKLNQNLNLRKNFHCFWVPKNKNLNPRIIIDDKETFLKKNEKQKITIKIIENNKIVTYKELEFNGFFEKSIKEIFKKNYKFEHIIFIEFYSKKFCYVQINYDNYFHGDQIHTHEVNFSINKNGKIIHLKDSVKKNCRKFMHLHFEKKNYLNYLVIYNSKLKDQTSKNIKLRLISENYFESIKQIKLFDNKIVEIINLNKEFSNEIKINKLKKAVIQIESVDGNFDSTLMCHNIKNDKISVDHLTGG